MTLLSSLKRNLIFLAVAMFILFVAAMPVTAKAPDAGAGVKKLVLLHTSDEHSFNLGVGPESEDYPPSAVPGGVVYLKGGLARKSTIIKQLRTEAMAGKAAVLTLSSGDNLMGTLAHVASETVSPDFNALRDLGYDATTFGNHDFEVGPQFLGRTLEAAIKKGKLPPIVATNVHFSGDTKAPDALLASYMDEGGKDPVKPIRRWLVIQTANGLKVGIVGALGASAANYAPGKRPVTFSRGPGKNDADFQDNLQALYRELQPVVDRLRNREKVDVVILLAHAGMDTEDWKRGESYQIAENVSGIDVILSGHTHLMVPYVSVRTKKTGREVIITEPGCYNQYVSKIALTVDRRGRVRFDSANSLVVPVTNAVSADPAMGGIVDAAIRQLEDVEDIPGRGSYLSRAVADITGRPVKQDGKPGSLYFYTFCKTRFDVFHEQVRAAESPMMRLVTDALLAQARLQNPAVEISLTGIGYVRDGVWKGQKGLISLADIFRSLPLGISPGEGTLGHPLALVGLKREHLKLLLEYTPSMAYVSGAFSDMYTTPAGICMEVDTARKPMDRVTKIRYAARNDNDRCDGAVIYDASAGGWQSGIDEKKVFAVALDYYHILFGFGATNIPLLRPDGTPAAKPADVILRWPSGNDVKSYQALAAHIQALCSAPESQGYLPGRYADLTPRRIACSGPLCGQDMNPATRYR